MWTSNRFLWKNLLEPTFHVKTCAWKQVWNSFRNFSFLPTKVILTYFLNIIFQIASDCWSPSDDEAIEQQELFSPLFFFLFSFPEHTERDHQFGRDSAFVPRVGTEGLVQSLEEESSTIDAIKVLKKKRWREYLFLAVYVIACSE